ncbi:SDR family NAD(P)-dependent oxidoreductase [Thalassospira sp. NFXS8]|uniref:SDR family NAD(P)-dependent oxidoreductase n=1 Tax=Thalassospira sp. NFXS8 TaxID=2819093 RepID=UPI0032DEAD35
MPDTTPNTPAQTILLIGASRGLGHAMAAEFLKKGWNVVGTVREGSGHTLLHDLQLEYQSQLEIEILDICKPDQLSTLHQRLSDRKFDILFVNAGTANPDPSQTIGEISTKDFTDLMITNALSPMRVIETLKACVTPTGTIGVMSSGQGSISNNETGLRELYRGTKAALNMFMRSFAAREAANADTSCALVTMAPGWVRTDLGGPEGRLSIDESIPGLVNVLLEKHGKPGLEYLDYQGRTVPW